MWIKTTDASGNSGDQWYSDHGLVDGEISGIGNDYGTAIGGGYFKLGIGNPDTTLTSTEKINDGNWHQVTATWNSGTGAMKIYVDGVLNASGTGPTGARNAVVNGLHIGNSHDGGNYFIGTLDDVELYNRVLDPTEIATLATGPAAAIYGFEQNLLDNSGNTNNGTLNGTLTYPAGVVGNYAAQFNGSNSWVSIPISIGTTNFSIAMWIKTTDASGNSGDQWYSDHGLVDGEIPGVVNDFGTAIGGGYFKLGIGNPDTTLTSTEKINDGNWHQVTATWNSGTGAMQIYVDGVLNVSGTGPTGPRNAVVNGLHIGNSHDSGHYFTGTLDQVELYNRILSPSQISTLALGSAAAVYGFEGNVLDNSGNNNNGTIYGSLAYTTGVAGSDAAQFNGINSWISIPDSIGSTSFTISLWINTTDGYGNEGDQWYEDHGLVDGEMPGVGNDFGTAIGGGYFKLGIGNPDTTLTSTVPVNDGTWHHVVATWNSTTGAMQIFLDGVLNASGTGPTGARTAVSNGLHIGNSHDGGNYFDGLLDDVELYNGIVPFPELNSL